MNIIYQGNVGRVGLTLAQGDLFEAEVDAIVNSEQTDFVLASNTYSISGQINHRFGQTVQPELDEATNSEVFRAGTIVSTSGGGQFKRIYHAGVHEPGDWPGEPGSSTYAQLLETIGSCLDQVLQAAASDGIKSVAFPLLGCGVLGLDERMLVLQFLHALEQFDRRWLGEQRIQVWLVIKDSKQMASVIGQLIGLLIEHREQTVPISVPQTGVPILDRFSSNLGNRSDANWAKWQLCRFTEIALEIICYGLGRSTNPAVTPESLFEEGMPATFGVVLEHALRFAAQFSGKFGLGWGAKFFVRVLRNEESVRGLETLNSQRNNLAHGRASMTVEDIKELMVQSLKLKEWEAIPQTDGDLSLTDWIPWVVASSSATGKTGIFERWQKNTIRYLIPETGEVFKVQRMVTFDR